MDALGRPATATHWLRGWAHHGSEDVHVTSWLYWPLTDPRPAERGA